MRENGPIIYQLNHNDEICFVNKEYDDFAAANAGTQIMSGQVLHRSLWHFITDLATKNLYRDLLTRVRAGHPVQFNFRCDSPSRRRLMHMDLTCRENRVEFRVHTLSEEDRPSQTLLEPHTPRSKHFLKMCGWCKKVRVGNLWVEMEQALTHLRLFELPILPSLTHGICKQCLNEMTKTLGVRA